jgi:hypothetical protein
MSAARWAGAKNSGTGIEELRAAGVSVNGLA